MSEIKKVVLAYSGGLDTSVIIPWLKEHYDNCEVIAVCGNVGQDDELDDLKQRAVASGASKLYVEDLTDEFVNEFVIPTMQAGADYEGYLLGTSLARPILAKRVVEIAKAEGADAVCHGSTGKGNDQVRFELAIMHFAPERLIQRALVQAHLWPRTLCLKNGRNPCARPAVNMALQQAAHAGLGHLMRLQAGTA